MTTITTLIPLPPDLVERDRVRRQAQRAGAITHPGLARLREVTFTGEGLALTWDLPSAEGDPADAILALASVAAGVATLHDSGLAHGGITAASIHVSEGRGVLSGWRPGGTVEGDVRDLGAVLDAWLLPSSVGADIAQLLISAQDPDPAARPSMAKVAAVLDRAATQRLHVVSPPAHRRARPVEVDSGIRGESTYESIPATRAASRAATQRPAPRVRGRHAAPGSLMQPAGVVGTLRERMSWRWGLAAAGTVAVAFLGLSALGSAGASQEVCPVPASAPQLSGTVDGRG
jgi:hypothetical protein